MHKKDVTDIDVKGKRILVRVDFNVPLDRDGKVADDTRIKAALSTINHLIDRGAKVILISHLGRPKGVEDKYRLDPIAESLSSLLGKKVKKVDQTVEENVTEAAKELKDGEVLLLENVRFNSEEKENNPEFAKKLADLGDLFVNDAFAVAHRAHASVVGVAEYLPAVSGFLLEKETRALDHLLHNPDRPFCAVLGGNKVYDKIGVIESFLDLVDCLLTGGGMCFTFLKAQGYSIGSSICQEEELEHSRNMLEKAKKNRVRFLLPQDVVIADKLAPDAEHKVVDVDAIPDGWIGVDIGPKTIAEYIDVIKGARTIFWNGPLGVFEMKPFSKGTRAIAEAIAGLEGVSIVGGGDSDAALRKYGLEDKISFVSTGGGASLKFLEGTKLPGIEVLMDK